MIERALDHDLDQTPRGIDAFGRLEVDELVALAAAGPAGLAGAVRALDEHARGGADERREVRGLLCGEHLEEALQAIVLLILGHVVAELERGREGTLRVLEAERGDEADLAHERERLLEVFFGLAGESDDDVGGEREAGDLLAQARRALDVLLPRVATRHATQHAIAAGLHREVHVAREDREIRVGVHQLFGEVTRVRRGVAEAREVGHFVRDAPEQLREARARRRGLAARLRVELRRVVPGVHRLTEQRDLADAALDHLRDLVDDLALGAVALGTARGRHDAEGAALVAALHHGDEAGDLGAPVARLGDEEARIVEIELGARAGRRAGLELAQQPRQLRDVVGTDHEIDHGRLLQQTLALLLRDAARDGDRDPRPLLLEDPQGAEEAHELVLGLLAHAAGVDHHEVGEGRVLGRLVAVREEDLLDPSGVVDVHLTAERLDDVALGGHGAERIAPGSRDDEAPVWDGRSRAAEDRENASGGATTSDVTSRPRPSPHEPSRAPRRRARTRLLLAALAVWTLGVGLEWEGRLARLERELESGDVTRRVEVVRLLGGYSADEVRGALLRALEDPEPSVRREAAEVVGRVRLRDALPMLLEWLEDPDAEVRAVAATSLGRLRESAAQGPLVRALGDAEASVRRAAVRALVELGEASALVPILGRLDDLDPDVRVETARGLARLGDPRAVVPLVGRARDDSVQVRQAVVGALGSLGDARAVPTVVLALRDDDEDVRLAAMGALGRLQDERASAELVAIAREGETRAARAALSALGAIGGERAREVAVESLANAELRPLASEVLSESTTDGETTWLAGRIARIDARDHASALAAVVLRRLRRSAEPSAAPALLAALERDVDHATVLRALASSGEPDVLVRLLTELGRESEPTRLAALEAIEDYFAIHPPDGRAADPLLAVLGRVPPSQRVRVVRLLGAVRATRAASAVRPLLDSTDPALRLAAVETLGALGDPRGTEALEPLLDADDGAVRDAAARALGRVADDATVRRLVAKLSDRAPTDRHALFTALGEALARGVTGDVATTLATLGRFVRHADEGLAAGAVATLGRWIDDGARDLLATLARDETYGSRAAAILALARVTHGASHEQAALFRALADASHASPATRAAAWVALGATGDASDVERLVRGVRESPGPIAAAAAFGLAQRLRRDPEAPVDGAALCALLARRDAYVRANVTIALAARRVVCEDRAPSTYLGREHAEPVRAAAARWAAAVGGHDEALARCATEDLAPNVAEACAHPELPPLDAHVDVHAFAGDGRTRLRHALVALRLADGSALVAWTDANGRLLWPLAPRGPIQLDDPLRVPLQP